MTRQTVELLQRTSFRASLAFLVCCHQLKEEQELLKKAFGMVIPGKTDQCHYPTFCELVDP